LPVIPVGREVTVWFQKASPAVDPKMFPEDTPGDTLENPGKNIPPALTAQDKVVALLPADRTDESAEPASDVAATINKQ
jgi:hypothetical protein